MKKHTFILLVLLAMLPSSVYAATVNTTGVYITPKAAYSLQISHEMQQNYYYAGAGFKDSGSDKAGHAFGGGVSVGYDFQPRLRLPFRVEFEYLIRTDSKRDWPMTMNGNTAKTEARFRVETVQAGFYIDAHNRSRFTPYGGIGIGTARIKAEFDDKFAGKDDRVQHNFTWHADVGVAMAFTKNLALDFNLRYADYGEVEVKSGVSDSSLGKGNSRYKSRLSAGEVLLGLRWSF